MRRIIITIIILLGFVGCCLISKSCANTTTPPSGGPKDTIPPVLMKATPDNYSTNFPLADGKIELLYDEYTIIKTATDIFLSPPSKKRPTAKVKGKNIVVTFNDTLLANRTYTVDFGQALADNNEGNLAPRLVYTFSTGEEIDSMYFTGSVFDCQTLKPIKNALVAVYSDLSDSAIFKSYPDAATRTDDWGFFVLRNIKPIPYRLYAYSDENMDSKYDALEESVAFLDSVMIPEKVIRDSIYELGSFIMKDTLECSLRESTYKLLMFKEQQTKQYLRNSGRFSEKMGYMKFNARDVDIRSFEIFGLDDSCLIVQYNTVKDSLDFWINTPYKLEDSLLVSIDYKKTDSLGNLVYTKENIAMAMPQATTANVKQSETKPKADTAFRLNIAVANEKVEQDGVMITLNSPAIACKPDSVIIFTHTNPKSQTSKCEFTLTQDTTDIRNYILFPKEQLKKGYTYNITIPQGMFTNLDNLPNLEGKAKFEIPNADKLSSITLKLSGIEARYIVELINDKMTTTYRTYHVERDTTLFFPYLKEGDYAVRITQDLNKNKTFDNGNLLAHKQPELVLLYYNQPDNFVIVLPEMTDLEQEINIKEMFK